MITITDIKLLYQRSFVARYIAITLILAKVSIIHASSYRIPPDTGTGTSTGTGPARFRVATIATTGQNLDSRSVECTFRLIIPGGCFHEEWDATLNDRRITPFDFAVLNFTFKSQVPNQQYQSRSRPSLNNVLQSDDDGLCEFAEIVEFPSNCIAQDKSVRFAEHVRCPRANVVEISGKAVWIESSTFPKYDVNYSDDTTGLIMECFSNDLLELHTDEKIQFSGIGVKLGKVSSNTKFVKLKGNISTSLGSPTPTPRPTQPIHWMEIQIPKDVKAGILQGYSGNYSLYFRNTSNEKNPEIKVQNYEILINDREVAPAKTPPVQINQNQGNKIDYNISPVRFRCTASSNENIYLAAIGGMNPVETRLLSRCLTQDIACHLKRVGNPCLQNRPCSDLARNALQPNGIVFCSHPTDGNKTLEYFTALDVDTYTSDPHTTNTAAIIQIQTNDEQIRSQFIDDYDYEDENVDSDGNPNPKPVEVMAVYDRNIHNFECHYVQYILVPSIIWKVQYDNKTIVQFHTSELNTEDIRDEEIEKIEGGLQYLVKIKSANFTLNFTREMTEISCSASFWDSSVFVNSSVRIEVLASRSPEFNTISKNERPLVVESGENFNVTCKSDVGAPPPIYVWSFGGKTINPNESCITITANSTTNSSRLSVCNAGPSYEGTFTCRAINFLGWDEKTFPVTVTYASRRAWIYFGIACALITLLLPIILVLYRIYLVQRSRLSAFEIAAFENGDEKELKRGRYEHQNAQFLPYNRDYEINCKNFEIDESSLLGEGAFGIVLKGKVRGRVVAIKTVRPAAEKSVVLALLSELKIMIYIGKHENIVELVGACTSMLKQGRPYVFVEFCENGDFHSFLFASRDNFIDQIGKRKASNKDDPIKQNTIPNSTISSVSTNSKPSSHYSNCYQEENIDASVHFDKKSESVRAVQNQYVDRPVSVSEKTVRKVSTMNLLKWAADIANGMEYLESKKVIHGDLATRNVLVTSSYGVKITDFGLSRQLQKNYTQYVKKQMDVLPWRWMAIESLFDMVFTSKSDVWSFGVTVWEMFTLAEVPFPEHNWTYEFMDELRGSNLRPPKPKYANDKIYEILLDCWHPNPQSRPSFTHLKNVFTHLSPNARPEPRQSGLNN